MEAEVIIYGESNPAEFCKRILPEWKDVELEQIIVTEKSGRSGNKNYKISAPANPSPIALHVIDQERYLKKNPDFLPRVLEGIKLFTKYGLTPEFHVSGKDFFITDWEGEIISGDSYDPCKNVSNYTFEDLGRFLAKIHKLPTDWFEPFKIQLRNKGKVFENAPTGCHLWWYVCGYEYFIEAKTEEQLEYWSKIGPYPKTKVGKRLVTSNFDFHSGNILQTEKGLKIIDFDYVTVNHAIQDFSYLFGVYCRIMKTKEQKMFVKAYLEESELPCSEKDINELILDIQICRISSNFFDLGYRLIVDNKLSEYKEFVEDSQKAYTYIDVEKHVRGWVNLSFPPKKKEPKNFLKLNQGSNSSNKTSVKKPINEKSKIENQTQEKKFSEIKKDKKNYTTASEIKKPEIKKPEIKKHEIKKPEIKKPDVKKLEIKKPEFKKPDLKKPEMKNLEIKKQEIKNSEIKNSEIKNSEIKKEEIKKEEIKKQEAKKRDIKKSEKILFDKKITVNKNLLKPVSKQSNRKTINNSPNNNNNENLKTTEKNNEIKK